MKEEVELDLAGNRTLVYKVYKVYKVRKVNTEVRIKRS